MAAMDELHIFLWAQKLNNCNPKIIHILHSHYPPSGNVQVILLKFKMATTSRLFYICDRTNSNLIYGDEWYRTSCSPLVLYRPTETGADPEFWKRRGGLMKNQLSSNQNKYIIISNLSTNFFRLNFWQIMMLSQFWSIFRQNSSWKEGQDNPLDPPLDLPL